MIALTNFQSYQNYFKAIAEDHKLLDDDKPYLFGDNEVANTLAKHWKGKKLWLTPPDPGQLQDQRSDNLLLRKPCIVYVGGAAGSAKFQDEYDYYMACEGIVIDILARIRKQYEEGTVVFDFPSVRIGWAEMMIGGTKFTFCRLDFNYNDPTGFTYNPAKWKSED